MQDLWCHTLQQSQHTPSFDQVTCISHIPHVNMLACLGPGFSSMSPDWIIMVVHCSFAVGRHMGPRPVDDICTFISRAVCC